MAQSILSIITKIIQKAALVVFLVGFFAPLCAHSAAKTVTSASFTFVVDDSADIYINGNSLGLFNCGGSCYDNITVVAVPPAWFTTECNIIAVTVADCC